MYESSSVMIDMMFSRKDRIIELPKSPQTQKKEDTYLKSLKLENFETADKSFNAEQARKNLSTIRIFNIKEKNTEETSVEYDEH